MPKNILEEIIKKKIEKIDILKNSTSLNSLTDIIDKNNSFINFKEKIQSNLHNNKISIIAEIKKASPSAGIIIQNYNPLEIDNLYNINNVTCLSVLTEEDYFLGSIKYLKDVKAISNLPILRKDFVIDEYQIYESKLIGADCILSVSYTHLRAH